MSTNNTTASFAFTLPISCQICLAKVKEPVCCDNNHVYCKACIAIWTSKNEHCPTCRVPIDAERPYRHLLGGQESSGEGKSTFSQPMIRKARVKSLFNSYEEEIQQLNGKIIDLQEENNRLSTTKAVPSTSSRFLPTDAGDSDYQQSAEKLNNQLSEVTQRYQKVARDLNRSEQEKTELEKANVSLTRENDRLRYDLSQRTPSKVGRFTVATLESQIEKQKKEIVSLEKALDASDKYIETLRGQLKQVPQHSQPSEWTHNGLLGSAHSVSKSLFSTELAPPIAPAAGVCLPAADLASSQEHSAIKDTSLTCPTQWKGSPVSQLLVSGLSSTTTGSDLTSCNSSVVSSPSKRKRVDSIGAVASSITLQSVNKSGLASVQPTLSSKVDHVDTESMFDGVQATDISITSEYTDCLRILHQAEKRVREKEIHQTLPS